MSKTAIVTGASRGIGKAIAIALANKGYNVAINYNKSKEEAEALESELLKKGFNVKAIAADVSNYKLAKDLVNKTIKYFNSVDVLVNNCGISQQKLFDTITEEDWDNMMNMNVKTMFNCTRHVVPIMLKKHSGNIINISSIWGEGGASCEVHYSASKAAVIGFTKALAKELGPSNIRVNCVAPGVIETDMLNDFTQEDLKELSDQTPLNRLGLPKDIANIVKFLVSNKSSFITGQTIGVNGGFVV